VSSPSCRIRGQKTASVIADTEAERIGVITDTDVDF
jgi:hypothetical protein